MEGRAEGQKKSKFTMKKTEKHDLNQMTASAVQNHVDSMYP